jgi:diguanylate cyclase (GGDEF)-like protein
MLSNRRGFMAIGQHALNLCSRLSRPALMLFFDLDGFKSINDRYGHVEGDRALADFAALLLRSFRSSDVVGRLGGDEFAVLMTDVDEPRSAVALQRLQEAVDEHSQSTRRGYTIRFSVGALAYDASRHASVTALLAEADALMYERKRRRRAA